MALRVVAQGLQTVRSYGPSAQVECKNPCEELVMITAGLKGSMAG
jgi:hypothetical protein